MQVIKPTAFQESMLISSSAIESKPNWSFGVSYALDAIVNYGGRLYQSLQASNLNHQPDLPASVSWWVDAGPDNKHAMFDRQISTGTTAGTSLSVVLATGTIDSIALINLDADVVTITVRNGNGGPIVYQQTGGLSGATVTDWYQYFFYDPLLKRTQLVFTGIPPYPNSYVTVEITSSATISIGEFIFGLISDIGDTQYGATAGIVDFSRKETDDFGTTTFVKRAYSKRMSSQVMLRNTQLNRVYSLLVSLRAEPAVWIGSDNSTFEEPLIVYGFYKDFSIDISYPQHSVCSLEIEGLT